MSDPTTGKKFLVTGATGNAGGLVASSLIERGEQVRCLVRSEEKAVALRKAGADIVIGDLEDTGSLAPAFAGIESVFLATAIGPRATEQASNGISAARSAGVTHLVRYSAVKASLSDNLRSSQMHAQVEELLAESGVPCTVIRPQTYMQNLFVAVETIKSDSAIYLPYGDAKLGMVDLRDIAEAAVTVLTEDGHTGRTYDITGPASVSMHEVAGAISRAIGKQVAYIDVPLEAARNSLAGLGIDQWAVDEYLAYFEAFKNGYADLVSDDFEQLTGHRQRTITDFANDYAAAFGALPANADA